MRGYYPLSLQSADFRLPTVAFSADRAAGALRVPPFQPSSPILSRAMSDDGADCSVTTVDSAGTAGVDPGTAAAGLVVDDTSGNFQASGSCFACSD